MRNINLSHWIGIAVGTVTLGIGLIAWAGGSRESGIRSMAIGLLAVVTAAGSAWWVRRVEERAAAATGPSTSATIRPSWIQASFTAVAFFAVGAGLALAAVNSDFWVDWVVYGAGSAFFSIVGLLVL